MTGDAKRLTSIVNDMSGKTVAVVGDLMLDRYYWGSVSRISPEAPVPVCLVERETMNLGGAANVANNIAHLGATALVFGVIGSDDDGQRVLAALRSGNFKTDGVVVDAARPTTVKLRVIAEDQHVVRVDREQTRAIDPEVESRMIAAYEAMAPRIDAVILEDYNKGVLTPRVIRSIIDISRAHGVKIGVDPKFENFFAYTGATVFKPNRHELERVLEQRLTAENEDALVARAMTRLSCESMLLTLGKKGMALFRPGAEPTRIPAVVLDVHDVSGAGDTVISTYMLALTSGAAPEDAMRLANLAAAVVCGKVGAQPVEKHELLEAIVTHVQ